MRRKQLGFVLLVLWVTLQVFTACSISEKPEKTEESLRNHIEWLSAEQRKGRLAGSMQEAASANYIADKYLQIGLEPFGDDGTYLQQFILEGPVTQALDIENNISRNVTGVVRGTLFPERFLVVGAHYDGQGTGGVLSLHSNTDDMIHPSADDNASGTAGLLYLAEKFANDPVPVSMIFVGFSGEEPGLLGSEYFVNEMNMTPDSLLAMINLDMIGRLQDEVTIFGSSTWSMWPEILEQAGGYALDINLPEEIPGNSDHAPFLDLGIPVLHYHTGIHDDYHRSTDSADKINYKGLLQVLEHVERVVRIAADAEKNRLLRESTSGND